MRRDLSIYSGQTHFFGILICLFEQARANRPEELYIEAKAIPVKVIALRPSCEVYRLWIVRLWMGSHKRLKAHSQRGNQAGPEQPSKTEWLSPLFDVIKMPKLWSQIDPKLVDNDAQRGERWKIRLISKSWTNMIMLFGKNKSFFLYENLLVPFWSVLKAS